MGCITSTLVVAQRQLHVTQEIVAALLEAPGNLTWSQPATWAGTAVGLQVPASKPSSLVRALKSFFTRKEGTRPRVYLRAQSARPQVGIDAQGDQPRPASSPAITLSATSLVDGLPASASAWIPSTQPVEISEIEPPSPVVSSAGWQGPGVHIPTEQVSLVGDTPVGGIAAQAPQGPPSPDTQAGAPAVPSHESSSMTGDVASPASAVSAALVVANHSPLEAALARQREAENAAFLRRVRELFSARRAAALARQDENQRDLLLPTLSAPGPSLDENENLNALPRPQPSLLLRSSENAAAPEYDPGSSDTSASAGEHPDRPTPATVSANPSLPEAVPAHRVSFKRRLLEAALAHRASALARQHEDQQALQLPPRGLPQTSSDDGDVPSSIPEPEQIESWRALQRPPSGLPLHFPHDEDVPPGFQTESARAMQRPPPGLPLPPSDNDAPPGFPRRQQTEKRRALQRPPSGRPLPSADNEEAPPGFPKLDQTEKRRALRRPPSGLPLPSADDEDAPPGFPRRQQTEKRRALQRPPSGLPLPSADDEDAPPGFPKLDQTEKRRALQRPPSGLPLPSADDEDAPPGFPRRQQTEKRRALQRPPSGLPLPSADDEDAPPGFPRRQQSKRALQPGRPLPSADNEEAPPGFPKLDQTEKRRALRRPPSGPPLPSSVGEDEASSAGDHPDRPAQAAVPARPNLVEVASAHISAALTRPALPAASRPKIPIPSFTAARAGTPRAPAGADTAAPVLQDKSDEVEVDRSWEVPLFDDGNGGVLCYDEPADFS